MTEDETCEAIFGAIRSFVTDHGYPPSVRDLADICGGRSTSTIHRYLLKLRQDGRVVWTEGQARTLRAVG